MNVDENINIFILQKVILMIKLKPEMLNELQFKLLISMSNNQLMNIYNIRKYE